MRGTGKRSSIDKDTKTKTIRDNNNNVAFL